VSETTVISDKLTEIAGLLRQAASQYTTESEKVATDRDELEQLRRKTAAGQIAKVAADQGFIDDDQVDGYADTLVDDETADLETLMTKMSSVAPRVRLGAADPTFNTDSGTGESRLVSRLTRNV
tara:strand:- start:16284 stop:16655 length:372 start_codon:yes stop_codon:yes gene_type:complete